MPDTIETLLKLYSLTEENFEEYYNKALLVLTAGKTPSKDKLLVIVGGQSGAGKSRLVSLVNQQLENNAIIVDFDELKALHPHYKEINKNYPEIAHRILHPDTEKVKNEILKTLREKEYNVIYEGALRNTQGFIDFAREFKLNNYRIQMNIMAVPQLESFGSTFVRYATALLTNATPRWVEKSAHDASYYGVLKTIGAFQNEKLTEDFEVYIRGSEKPKKIYSTGERQYKDVLTAVQYGREIGRRKAIEDFKNRYEPVKSILNSMKPELVNRLDEWKKLYDDEVEYFNLLNEARECND